MEKNDSKTLFFPTWDSWRAYIEKAVIGFAKGFISILYAIVIGLATLIYNACVALKKLVLKYPVCSLSILCVVLAFLLLFNYVRFSAKMKACEIERDSISYQLSKIEQAFSGDTIIINGHCHVGERMGLLTPDLDEETQTKE